MPKYIKSSLSLRVYAWNLFYSVSKVRLCKNKMQLLQRSGAIYKCISFPLDCLTKRICARLNTAEWSYPYSRLLVIPISSNTDGWNLHFLECNKFHWLGPLFFFNSPCCSDLLLGAQLEQNDTAKSVSERNRADWGGRDIPNARR